MTKQAFSSIERQVSLVKASIFLAQNHPTCKSEEHEHPDRGVQSTTKVLNTHLKLGQTQQPHLMLHSFQHIPNQGNFPFHLKHL